MFQSEVEGRIVDWSLLTKDVQPEYHHDLDYLVSMLDWDANVDPEFAQNEPGVSQTCAALEEMKEAGYRENWVTYGTATTPPRKLTVLPKRSAAIRDSAAYGLISDAGVRRIRENTPCPLQPRFDSAR